MTGSEEINLWYKDAIIYQTHIRAFFDSDGDGIGDFCGLASKLDYIQDLGVTAIWILPFYPSPLRDDGYDIADYTDVHPSYGTLADFKNFLKAAHDRGLKVITELVLNHTSDQHEWFQRSRRAAPGDKMRDFYVWSDTTDRYKDTRIIFRDFEPSNWSWDPVAKAYYWHRFYSHQPDLNFDNPDVHRAMIQVLDFWLKMGVDGLRLDAVPYLYEREGTSCENLPETHEFLKKLRAHVDSKYSGRMLLAEANQWPEDAVAYFGRGDECHMAFHFPLMPRLFMAVQQEDRYPVIDILRQTPSIPENCQWTIFLRNHDELTLEMVTDEERDYMYRVYAQDPEARINLGIRRRLAPLLGNNRRKLELMNGLLFSLPGTPVIYYGDEIGMGDNIYLGDRDSVRTPMQWSADRNAGFSHANPQRLFLPLVIDPEYNFNTRNVEVQQNSPFSILWWMKRIIDLRKEHQVFGRGSLEFLSPDNSKVLAFIRRHEKETLLVIANLSRFTQSAELDLSAFKGMKLVEMFGKTAFPPIDDRAYHFALGPHDFYWLSLQPTEETTVAKSLLPSRICRLADDWLDVFHGRARDLFEETLKEFLPRQHWYISRARVVQSIELRHLIALDEADPFRFVLAQASYVEGEPETYLLPVMYLAGEHAMRFQAEFPGAVIMTVELSRSRETGILVDAARDHVMWSECLEAVERKRRVRSGFGESIPSQTKVFRGLRGERSVLLEPSLSKVEQSNSSAVFGDRLIMKLFRRIDPGVNPDLEICRFLANRGTGVSIPALAGALEYQLGKNEPITLGILHEFMPETTKAWDYTLDHLGRFFERASTEFASIQLTPEHLPEAPFHTLLESEIPPLATEAIGTYLHSAELIGRRTAELHLALSSELDDPAFKPEPFTPFYQRSLYQSMRNQAERSIQLLRKQQTKLPEAVQIAAKWALARESEILQRIQRIHLKNISALRIRCHGDFHLGQVLYTGKDFLIIDFEGEPSKAISERRIKRSPLRDVAGMIRSFHYASHAGLLTNVPGLAVRVQDKTFCGPWAKFWYTWTSAVFLKSYVQAAGGSSFLPSARTELDDMLTAYLMEKSLYELEYELNSRPEWVEIPLHGILSLMEGPTRF